MEVVSSHEEANYWRRLGGDWAAALGIFLLPVFIFFRHNDYPLASAEFLIFCTIVAIIALVTGGMMSIGRWARVFVTTCALILLVDLQTSWITTIGLRLGLTILVFGTVSWLLGRRLPLVTTMVFGAMILGTVLQPPGQAVRYPSAALPTGEQDLPFLLHIILDEYAAPGALDSTFDHDGEVAAEISRFFTANGFRLYPRAYSRLVNTAESLPAIFNPGLPATATEYWPQGWAEGGLLAKNAWFARLVDLGYGLQVVQSDFLRFLDENERENWPPRTVLTHYTAQSIHALAGKPLSVDDKLRSILGGYCRLSWLLEKGRDVYTGFRVKYQEQLPWLSDWDAADGLVSSLTSMEVTLRLVSDLKKAQPGQAVVAHILLPHFPYAFKSDCAMAPMGRKWLNSFTKEALPARNTPASRAERYPLYLDQITCTNLMLGEMFDSLREAGVWDNSIIILHGDHGSRLNVTSPLPEYREQMTAKDFADAFGTLLAIKLPGEPAALDRRQIPLDDFFEQVLLPKNGIWPPLGYNPEPEILAEPWVILTDRKKTLLKVALPSFGEDGLNTGQ